MATCPNCGAANVTARFCGNCGAQMPAVPPVAPAAMPQPPQAPQFPQAPQPPQAPQNGQQQYPGYPGQPGPVPDPTWAFRGQGQPNYGPAPQPKPKSNAGLIAAVAGGVVVLGVAGFLVYRSLSKPDVTPPANPPAANTVVVPPGTPMPKLAIVATGKFDFPYQSYDSFGRNQVVLAQTQGDRSQVMDYEFKDGKFQEAVAVDQPFGKVNDVNHGPIFNDGKDYAIIPAEQGLIMVPEDGDAEQYDGKNLRHVLVGDFDGDKQYETLTILQDGTNTSLSLFRYDKSKQGNKLKSITVPVWLEGTQVVNLAGVDRSLLLGVDSIKVQDRLPLALYDIGGNLDLKNFASLTVHQTAGEQITGYAAGNIAGKPTLVVAYDGNPGYLEFFEINTAKPNPTVGLQPPSRGKLTLRPGSGSQVMLGYFTQTKNLEVLTLTQDGNWTIYSY